MHEIGALSPTAWLIASILKVVAGFTIVMVVVAFMTLLERKLAGWIQDRLGPNRVGPGGIMQPLADGLKNILKEETLPKNAARFFFVLAPMIAIIPALVTFAVVPVASPLPTPWGLVDMVIADVPVGILFILALSGLGVYGVVLAGWSSFNKYAFLGGLRASAQLVSYEVGLGLSLIPVIMIAGNVTLTQIVWTQQGELGLWFALPLGLSFFLFVVSAFAETSRLPFDMPEAESELVAGYHSEYSAMKFSMFMIAEFAHMLTASMLMATLFLGGWDIPFWTGDDMVVVAPGVVQGAEPTVGKTLLTFATFAAKTMFFVFVYMWVRWTLPRFRYDQIMDLGWKVLFEVALAFIILVGATMLILDKIGIEFGPLYGAILTVVNLVAMAVFFWFVDRDRVISGASRRRGLRKELRGGFTPIIPGETGPRRPAAAEPEAEPELAPAGVE